MLLLYPERGMHLNNSAAAVVSLLTGEMTEEAIVDVLVERYRAPRAEIEKDVEALLDALAARALLIWEPE